MKRVKNVKEIMIILISVVLITILSTSVFATDLVLGDNQATTLTGNEYDNAQTVPTDNTATDNIINTTDTNVANTDNTANTVKTYNTTNTSEDDLPQTGIEDYNIGILLIIFIASAIFAYKKINDYKNI